MKLLVTVVVLCVIHFSKLKLVNPGHEKVGQIGPDGQPMVRAIYIICMCIMHVYCCMESYHM